MRKSILLSLGLLSVVTLSSCVTDPDGIINEDRTKTLVETYSNDSVSKYESGNYHTISKTSGTIEPAIEGVVILKRKLMKKTLIFQKMTLKF